MCKCNCKGKLIYKSTLQRKEYTTYLKIYKDDNDNLIYEVVTDDYSVGTSLRVFGCPERFPDVLQEITYPVTNYPIDIRIHVKKHFDELLKTSTFEVVESKSF